jgi:hypothetical protein
MLQALIFDVDGTLAFSQALRVVPDLSAVYLAHVQAWHREPRPKLTVKSGQMKSKA